MKKIYNAWHAMENKENILQEPERTAYETLKVQVYGRKNLYQTLVEIHPEKKRDKVMTADECMSKVVLYIARWIRGKLRSVPDEDIPEGLRNLPDPDTDPWKDYHVDEETPISNIDIKIPAEIRTLYYDNCWTVRFNEIPVDSRIEYIDNFSVTKEENSVVLAVKTEGRYPLDSGKEMEARRPGFLKNILEDEDIFVTEKLSETEEDDLQKTRLERKAMVISGNSKKDAMLLYKLLTDPMRNMPVLMVPEPRDEETSELTNELFNRGVYGYYYVVYIEGSWIKFLNTGEEENADIRKWMSDQIENGKWILIAPWNGNSQDFNYYALNTSEYVVWEKDKQDYGCRSFNPKLVGMIKEQVQLERVDRDCNFGGYRFNRELWNTRIDKEIEEIRKQLKDVPKFEEFEENYEEKIKLKDEKIAEIEQNNITLKEENDRIPLLEDEKTNLKKENETLTKRLEKFENEKRTEEKKSAADEYLKTLIDDKNIKELKKEPMMIIDEGLVPASELIRNEILQRVKKHFADIFEGKKATVVNRTRREDVLSYIFAVNTGIDFEDCVLLYYPSEDQIYENEYKNLMLDELLSEKGRSDKLLSFLADHNNYDRMWKKTLEDNLLKEMKYYNHHDGILSALQKYAGVELKRDKNKAVFGLRQDDRYTVTGGKTPSTWRGGRQLLDKILEVFF